jgi:hypothetical protein
MILIFTFLSLLRAIVGMLVVEVEEEIVETLLENVEIEFVLDVERREVNLELIPSEACICGFEREDNMRNSCGSGMIGNDSLDLVPVSKLISMSFETLSWAGFMIFWI